MQFVSEIHVVENDADVKNVKVGFNVYITEKG